MRRERSFVEVNCAAIPEDLIESELFGHTKGAFTGALVAKKGKFELADTGTLFLDEVGDMTLKTQAKVLRVLQEQELERLGSNRIIKVDVRVIAATNKNLEEEINRNAFREDLFYRLNVVPVHVPALRERRDDIPDGGAMRTDTGAAPGGAPQAPSEAAWMQAPTLQEFKANSERAYLVTKLRENAWNISKTAEVIDTPRSNLYKKLEQYAISQEADG